MAYGYGLSVSLMQIAHAYTTFARNGDMVSLTLLKREGKPTSIQVYRPEVAAQIRAMLEAAAGPDGAKLAQVQGYRVAGKSGTARQIVDGKYSRSKYRSSFVGFAPVSNPRIVVAVSIDEPHGKGYYGGRVAAPVFSNIVASSLRRLGPSNRWWRWARKKERTNERARDRCLARRTRGARRPPVPGYTPASRWRCVFCLPWPERGWQRLYCPGCGARRGGHCDARITRGGGFHQRAHAAGGWSGQQAGSGGA
jgi:membrane peptidoglycan carboxypeptidase